MYKIKQTESLFITLEENDNISLSGYSGKWELKNKITDDVLIEDDLIKVGDNEFEVRLTTTMSEQILPSKTLVLIVWIENASIGFKDIIVTEDVVIEPIYFT